MLYLFYQLPNSHGFDAQLTAELGKKETNTNRVTKNWAVLITVYQLLSRFMRERNADDLLPIWQDIAAENVRALSEEQASKVFLDNLGQLLGGGQVVIDANMKQAKEYPSSVTVIGYKDDCYVYLLPDIALREVNKLQPMHFTATAIGMQLKEDGILIPSPSNLTTQKRFRGNRVRFWQLTAELLLETGVFVCLHIFIISILSQIAQLVYVETFQFTRFTKYRT